MYLYKYPRRGLYSIVGARAPMAKLPENEEYVKNIQNDEWDVFDTKVCKILGNDFIPEDEIDNDSKLLNTSLFKPLNKQHSQTSSNDFYQEDFMMQLLHVKEKIKKKFDHLLFIVEQRRLTLLSHVERLAEDYTRKNEAFEKERSKISDVISMADELGNESADLRDNIRRSSKRRMSQLSCSNAITWNIRFKWKEYSELIEDLGKVEVTHNPNYLLRNESFPTSIHHGSRDNEIKWATGLALANNNIYVADSEDNRVQIYTQDGEHVTQLTSPKMNWPFGVCVKGEMIYVTQCGTHTVGLYNSRGVCFATCGGKGNGSDKLNRPSGLAVDESDLFVCDQDNHRIQVFDSKKLSHKRKISSQSFNHPNDCSVCSKELLVLTLSDPCMHSFTLRGQLLRQFLSWGPGKEVTSSTFFTVDHLGNIIISDLGGNCLKVFSYEGAFLSKITCNGALNQPRGIGLDSSGQIYVSHRGKVGNPSVILMC
ncbi:hypothetical protein LOD99_9254 [Oopsacas minuta]|uniref:Uncharacterized protein n=1 Tax=Oopsacas minuta TaxID=111878 RepID=A0AAV7JC51_9METZ|nr:hypothetical protein LOD99_9254 [Oopsacas minuta]